MEAIAKTRHLKGSPRKARLVIDLIRGRNVSQALNILKFTDKRAAEPITKTLRSAIANATYLAEQQNIAIDPDDLFVKTCFVDMGAHKNRRRMRPAPQGRAFREQRHYCHITILVSSDLPKAVEEANAKKAAAEKSRGDKKATAVKTKESVKAMKSDKTEKPETMAEATVEETMPIRAEVISPANVEEDKRSSEVAANDAMIANAKNVESQRPAEMNATQQADEAQLDQNDRIITDQQKG